MVSFSCCIHQLSGTERMCRGFIFVNRTMHFSSQTNDAEKCALTDFSAFLCTLWGKNNNTKSIF